MSQQVLSASREMQDKMKFDIRTNSDMAALSVWMQKQAISIAHMGDGKGGLSLEYLA